jgi:hypothetical protein
MMKPKGGYVHIHESEGDDKVLYKALAKGGEVQQRTFKEKVIPNHGA